MINGTEKTDETKNTEIGGIKIRTADLRDCGQLSAIYSEYVEKTAVSFEYKSPSAGEFAKRMSETLKMYPYLTAEKDGVILGYAYAAPFKDREAYGWAAETSVYIRPDCKKAGIGRALYEELENFLSLQGVLNMNACVAFTEREDEYLTRDSVLFHEKMGFTKAGVLRKCGYKFNRWYDIIWMEKHIGRHLEFQCPIKPFNIVKRV